MECRYVEKSATQEAIERGDSQSDVHATDQGKTNDESVTNVGALPSGVGALETTTSARLDARSLSPEQGRAEAKPLNDAETPEVAPPEAPSRILGKPSSSQDDTWPSSVSRAGRTVETTQCSVDDLVPDHEDASASMKATLSHQASESVGNIGGPNNDDIFAPLQSVRQSKTSPTSAQTSALPTPASAIKADEHAATRNGMAGILKRPFDEAPVAGSVKKSRLNPATLPPSTESLTRRMPDEHPQYVLSHLGPDQWSSSAGDQELLEFFALPHAHVVDSGHVATFTSQRVPHQLRHTCL